MPNCGKYEEFCPKLVLIILGIMILAPVGSMLSNNSLAQTLHDRTLYEAAKQTIGLQDNAHIDVNTHPMRIAFSSDFFDVEKVYVVNSGANTISVISTENHSKLVPDIPVGEVPVDIFVDDSTETVYVSNRDSNTVSVISGKNYSKLVPDIPVGESTGPISHGINTIYVVGSASDTVSLIFRHNSSKILPDIPVGKGPVDIDVDIYGQALYVANSGSDTVSVISTENHSKLVPDIPVGESPYDIVVDEGSDKVFVGNEDGTISVISGKNYSKLVPDIPAVGHIAVDEYNGKMYVANFDTISVISKENHSKLVPDIPVGEGPTDIAIEHINEDEDGENESEVLLYVANYGSGTISVISGKNYSKLVPDILVGEGPQDILVDDMKDTVYVANRESGTVSVIDGIANKVVAGVTFQVSPFNSGSIVCDDLTTPSDKIIAPTRQYTYVYSGAQCTAKPNPGFEFVSWEENLEDNSSQPISVSAPPSISDSIANFFGVKGDKPEATLNITKFGTFTANFRELSPPVPEEFWIQTYVVVGTVIAGLFIPSIVGWTKSKTDVRKLRYYHEQITSLYGDGKLDENDIDALDRLRSRVVDAYSEGKLNEKHYESLQGEISTLYEEIFRKKIAVLDGKYRDSGVKKPVQEQLAELRNEIKYAFSKGKINDKHYALLNEYISKLDDKDNDNSS